MIRLTDTNIFLRYLTQPETDDQRFKHEAAAALIRRVTEGDEEILVTEWVVAEVLYVLCSKKQYSIEREEAIEHIRPLILLPGIRMVDKLMCFRALELFRVYRHLDIEDALNVAFMERHGIREVLSFDRDYDRIPGIDRIEPQA